MQKIIEYKTVTSLQSELFDKSVNKHIQEGWQPFGTPHYNLADEDAGNSWNVYWQAMVRYE